MFALLDFIPLIAFFIVALTRNIIDAAGALLIGVVIVSIIHFFKQKYKLQKHQWVILFITIVFCSLTLILRDDAWVKWKSTVVSWLFASVLIMSVLLNKLFVKKAGQKIVNLTDNGWKKLTLSIAGFFFFMGVLNYILAFHFTNDRWWIYFKTFGGGILNLIFFAGVAFVLRDKLILEEEK